MSVQNVVQNVGMAESVQDAVMSFRKKTKTAGGSVQTPTHGVQTPERSEIPPSLERGILYPRAQKSPRTYLPKQDITNRYIAIKRGNSGTTRPRMWAKRGESPRHGAVTRGPQGERQSHVTPLTCVLVADSSALLTSSERVAS